jgi:hypothetical protein
MEVKKIFEIVGDVENKSNKDLLTVISELEIEFKKTKELIIDLTHHLERIEDLYNKTNNELSKRTKK